MKRADEAGVVLIDVRTRAEVKYIGIVDSVDANIRCACCAPTYAWSEKPTTYRTRVNSDFVAAVDGLQTVKGLGRDAPVILMCQSGSRVPLGARLLHAAGFARVYTQDQGFEGYKAMQGPDKGKRVVNGWKNAGLPWRYELDPAKLYFDYAPRESVQQQRVRQARANPGVSCLTPSYPRKRVSCNAQAAYQDKIPACAGMTNGTPGNRRRGLLPALP